MNRLRTAVIGVGYLGKFHAEKYAALGRADLVAVADSNATTAANIAQQLDCRAVTDYRDLLGQVDAVSVVVPTQLHHRVTKDFLERGTHVLVEKPITATAEQAQELIDIATAQNLVLQVGHLERFNPSILALEGVLSQPQFIESHRVAPFNPRGADVNVILDLMIHDIDIILDIVAAPVQRIDANGVAVLSKDVDIANARIAFTNGCVANVTASRAGLKRERKMRLFQHDAYITIDFQNKKLGIHRKGKGEMYPGIAEIDSEERVFDQGDALKSEIESFLDCIVNAKPPVVSGMDGKRALETAIEITRLLHHPDH
ncbi:MAG: UDP-N-acetyl-D-glucosamine dehydrogenase [Thiotrichales bacterium SG8_50]|nr:MAG: UDP-N-acetyl-D-glucosamine dehydrogenase [Thiotrichales bacterium SG8_50]